MILSNFKLPPSNFLPRSATLQRAFSAREMQLTRHTFAEAARYALSLSNFTFHPSNF